MCVCERERERERESVFATMNKNMLGYVWMRLKLCHVYVHMCMDERT